MSSLRKQGPITTDLRFCAKVSDKRLSTQPTRRMGPCFRRDDRDGRFQTHFFLLAARLAPESCMNLSAPRSEGAGNAGRAVRTRSLACEIKSTRVSYHGYAGSPGIPRAMVLTVSFA